MQSPNIPAPVRDTRRPRIKFPPGACDCHAHIFGPAIRYKVLPNSHFVPPDCLLADYIGMLRAIGCGRVVLVQPSVYGTDNAAMNEALKSRVFDLRAVAVVSPAITDRELEDLHVIGFRGIRINVASEVPGLNLDHARTLAKRIKPLGWHLQFHANLRKTPELAEHIAKLSVDVVIDHFGRIVTAEGVDAPPFRALLALLRYDHCWAKLMGPYFISDAAPSCRDIVPFAKALAKTAPDRVLWGTDWPHPAARANMPDDGDLADMLLDWVPDEAQRRKMLVDNPRRLYGFR